MNKDIDLVLEIAQKWFESNVMLLNYNKTSFMQFSSNIYDQSPDNTQVGNHRISLRNSFKFLGIAIESSLTWRIHTEQINSKLNSLGYMLRILRPILSLNFTKQIYFSYVQMILNYGIMFWGNSHIVKLMLKPKKDLYELL